MNMCIHIFELHNIPNKIEILPSQTFWLIFLIYCEDLYLFLWILCI